MRRLLPVLLVAFLAPTVMGYDVAREELEGQVESSVEFINYEGPYETIESIGEIRGIGEFLGGDPLSPGASRTYFSRYSVFRAIDPSVELGLDADIFSIDAGARVDHIDSLRLILGGYLQSAFQYSDEDASLLSRFITIYNAVFRGNQGYIEMRYKPIVLDNIDPDRVGLALRYDQWPGQSQILIPLTEGAAPGRLDSISPIELVGAEVIEELRARRDMGIADRKSMIDLLERIIEEREEEIQQEREAIAEAEEAVQEREEAAVQEREEIEEATQEAEETGDEEAQQEVAERQQELTQEEEAIVEERGEIQEREEAVEQAEEELEPLIEAVQQLYDDTARDQRLLLDQAEDLAVGLGTIEPVTVLQVTERSGVPYSRLIQINPATRQVMLATEVDTIVGRTYIPLDGDYLVLLANGNEARLAMIDANTLGVNQEGEDVIFLSSILLTRSRDDERSEIYAIVENGGEWYVGRFDEELRLVARSAVAVNPYTVLTFADGNLYVQSSTDEIVPLLEDTMEAPDPGGQ